MATGYQKSEDSNVDRFVLIEAATSANAPCVSTRMWIGTGCVAPLALATCCTWSITSRA